MVDPTSLWVRVLPSPYPALEYPPGPLEEKTIKTIFLADFWIIKTGLLVDFSTIKIIKTRKPIKTTLLVDFWSTLVALWSTLATLRSTFGRHLVAFGHQKGIFGKPWIAFGRL